MHGCTIMLRKKCFKEAGKFNADYRYAHDYDVWLRMASKYKIGYIDKVHVRGREYSNQISMQGNNEIDAIHVLFDFIKSDAFENLYRKAGYISEANAIEGIIVGQLKTYKHRKKEYEELLSIILNDKSQVIKRFWEENGNTLLCRVVSWLYDGEWPYTESFFEDDTQESYLNLLCKAADVEVFIVNNQAIRFDRFSGNSIERFHMGLMRRNDIVTGIVNIEELKKFLQANGQDYRCSNYKSKRNKIKIGFTYYMYQMLHIHEQLNMENVKVTEYDMWWELSKQIYKDKILK